MMDAAGSERAVLAGFETGFAVAAMFAATYPERTAGLVAYSAKARELWAPDYPFGMSEAAATADVEEIERAWGTPELATEYLSYINPAAKDDDREVADLVRWMQSIGGPGDAVRWAKVDHELDLRDILGSIRVPTLVLHSQDDLVDTIEHARYLAAHIPGAELQSCRGPRTNGTVARTSRARSNASSRRSGTRRSSSTVTSPPCCSPTSQGRRRWPLRSAMLHGGPCSNATTTSCAEGSPGIAAPRWTRGRRVLRHLRRSGPRRPLCIAIGEGVRELGIDIRAGVHTGEVQTIDGRRAASQSRSVRGSWRRPGDPRWSCRKR